jgi:hypothetical protein
MLGFRVTDPSFVHSGLGFVPMPAQETPRLRFETQAGLDRRSVAPGKSNGGIEMPTGG